MRGPLGLAQNRGGAPSPSLRSTSPRAAGRGDFYFTGATATAIVHTSLLRLMISRLSFGPM